MAFGFFGRRRKNNRGEQPRADSTAGSGTPENTPAEGSGEGPEDFTPTTGRNPGDPIEQQVQRDLQGRLSPADLLPDADLPPLDRSRANMLRRELEYRFALKDAQIDINGNAAMVLRPDGGVAHVSLKALAINAASLDNLSQLPELVDNFVHGTLADATLRNLSTAELYKSLRLRLLPTPEDDALASSDEGLERQIRDNSVLRGFTSDTSIALVLDTDDQPDGLYGSVSVCSDFPFEQWSLPGHGGTDGFSDQQPPNLLRPLLRGGFFENGPPSGIHDPHADR